MLDFIFFVLIGLVGVCFLALSAMLIYWAVQTAMDL